MEAQSPEGPDVLEVKWPWRLTVEEPLKFAENEMQRSCLQSKYGLSLLEVHFEGSLLLV